MAYEGRKGNSGKDKTGNSPSPHETRSVAGRYPRPSRGIFTGSVLLLFSLYMLFCVLTGRVHYYWSYVYFWASLATIIAYCFDKMAAQSGKWRTRESTLHTMAFLCGWPGAYLAQRLIRHKTSKKSFRVQFVVTVLLNITAFVIYASPEIPTAIISLINSGLTMIESNQRWR